MIDEVVGGSEIEENEDSSVAIDDNLDPEGAPARRILRLGAKQRPPVVARSGRVVTVGYLGRVLRSLFFPVLPLYLSGCRDLTG